jgi:hypothetical protein
VNAAGPALSVDPRPEATPPPVGDGAVTAVADPVADLTDMTVPRQARRGLAWSVAVAAVVLIVIGLVGMRPSPRSAVREESPAPVEPAAETAQPPVAAVSILPAIPPPEPPARPQVVDVGPALRRGTPGPRVVDVGPSPRGGAPGVRVADIGPSPRGGAPGVRVADVGPSPRGGAPRLRVAAVGPAPRRGESGLRVERIVVGPTYAQYTCPAPTDRFSLRVHREVNVCLEIAPMNAPVGELVTVVWERNGILYGATELDIAARHFRLRTRVHMAIDERRTGDWAIRVLTAKGKELARSTFQVGP